MLGLKLFESKAKRQPSQAVSADESGVILSSRQVLPPRHTHLGRHLGFALEDDGIQMATAVQSLRSMQLLDVRKVYFGKSLASDEERERFICESLQQYISEFGSSRATTSLAVSGAQTAFRTLNMPAMADRLLAQAVQFEGRRQLPFPDAQCLHDFRVVEDLTTSGGKRLRVSLVGATKESIDRDLAMFDRVGYPLEHVYHQQDALGQLLGQLPDYDPEASHALINVQRSRTIISYYRGAELVFLHGSSIGSSFLSNRTDPTTYDYFAESLATEIQNSLDYYSGQFSAHFSNQVLVYGDLAYSSDLIDRLSDRFGFDFVRFPAEELTCARTMDEGFHPDLPVCLAAIAVVTTRNKLANLLPEKRRQQHRRRYRERRVFASLGLMTLALMALWFVLLSQTRAARHEAESLESQVQQFQNSDVYKTYSLLRHQITRDQAFVAKAQETPSFASMPLKELGHLTPEQVRLHECLILPPSDGRNMTIAGIITTSETPPELVLAEFVENMIESPFYDDIQVDRHVKRDEGETFELEFQISLRGVL